MQNIVYNQDCMVGMAEFPDKYFDLAIVDPPYGIGDFTHNKKERLYRNNIVTATKFKVNWNDKTPSKNYFTELLRVSKNRIIWGANYYNCFEKGAAIVWFKNTKHPNISLCEIASVSRGVKVDFFHYDWYSLNRCEQTIHPCQKPVALYRWLLEKYAKLGQKILDTHIGSGSIRIACYDFGCELIGYEIDKDYFDAQEKRFQDYIKQGRLFEPEIKEYKQGGLF